MMAIFYGVHMTQETKELILVVEDDFDIRNLIVLNFTLQDNLVLEIIIYALDGASAGFKLFFQFKDEILGLVHA